MAENDGSANQGVSGRDIPSGFVTPGSELEAASIAAGIPPASLDIYYDDSSEEMHAHDHSYPNGSQVPTN